MGKINRLSTFTKEVDNVKIEKRLKPSMSSTIENFPDDLIEADDINNSNYVQGSYQETFKNEIADYITKLIVDYRELGLKVVDGDNYENEFMTELYEKNILKGKFLQNLKFAFFNSLKKGDGGVRVSGDIFKPILYNLTTIIKSKDYATDELYELYVQYRLVRGTYPKFAFESYKKGKGIQTTISGTSSISFEKGDLAIKEKTKGKTYTKGINPYVYCELVFDDKNNDASIF
jgi:hypothetical protein